MRRASALAVALGLAAALAACGEQPLESDRVESTIEDGIEKQSGTSEVEVECPEEIEVGTGEKFTCTARADDAEAPVEVTRRDAEGNIRWEIKPRSS